MQFNLEHFDPSATLNNQPNHIASLQQKVAHALEKALYELNKKKSQLEQNQQGVLTQEKDRFLLVKKKIDQDFKEAQTTWSAYQQAKTKHTADTESELNLHTKKIADIELYYRLNLEQLILDYQNKTLQIEQLFKQKLAEKKKSEIQILSRKYDAMIAEAREVYQKEEKEIFSHYQAISRLEDQKLHAVLANARLESYRMLASAIGFDDIVLDSKTNKLGYDERYEAIQPLLSYTDLRQALQRDIKTKPLTDLISIFVYGLPDNPVLQKIVQSLDFSFNSQFFRHQCLDMTPPNILERNTLYIEKGDNTFTCTLLCPYGTVLQKKYNAASKIGNKSLSIYFESDSILNYIKENSSHFVADIYYRNKAIGFDAFKHLIDTVDGFKSHVTHSILTYNKHLVASSGLLNANLTQLHLFRAGSDDYVAQETTPLHLLQTQHKKVLAAARIKYEALLPGLKRKYAHAVEEADKWFHAAKSKLANTPEPSNLSISQTSIFCTSKEASIEPASGEKSTSVKATPSESSQTIFQNNFRQETSRVQRLATIHESLHEDSDDVQDDDYCAEIEAFFKSWL